MIKLLLILNVIILPLQQKKVLDQSSDFISSDMLGNLYCINDEVITKFNSNGEILGEYSNLYFGKISLVDTSDPLRILLLYKDFNQALFLNKNMTEIGDPIDLYEFTSNETTLICSSQQGGFWIFNFDDMQAIRISAQRKPVTKTIFLNNFFEEQLPTALVEKNDKLYFLIPNKGILVLTDQGQFYKMFYISGIQSFQIKRGIITYVKNKKLYNYDPILKDDFEFFPGKKFFGSKYRVEEGIIYNSSDSNIYIYITL